MLPMLPEMTKGNGGSWLTALKRLLVQAMHSKIVKLSRVCFLKCIAS